MECFIKGMLIFFHYDSCPVAPVRQVNASVAAAARPARGQRKHTRYHVDIVAVTEAVSVDAERV